MSIDRNNIMSSDKSTPTVVPQRLPSPLTTTLRNSVSSALLNSHSSIPTIEHAFSSALQTSGWTERLNARVLELLRSGECGTYDEVMDQILVESRNDNPGNKRDSKGGTLEVPTKAVEDGIEIVRTELGRAGVKVEEED